MLALLLLQLPALVAPTALALQLAPSPAKLALWVNSVLLTSQSQLTALLELPTISWADQCVLLVMLSITLPTLA